MRRQNRRLWRSAERKTHPLWDDLVEEGEEADAFVSAGSSGAVLAGGQLLVGRIERA